DVGDAGCDVLGALGLANLDGAELFLQEVFGRRLLGDAMYHFNGLLFGGGCRRGASRGAFSGGLGGFGRLGLLLASGGRGGVAFSGGGGSLDRLFFLRSGFLFGHLSESYDL